MQISKMSIINDCLNSSLTVHNNVNAPPSVSRIEFIFKSHSRLKKRKCLPRMKKKRRRAATRWRSQRKCLGKCCQEVCVGGGGLERTVGLFSVRGNNNLVFRQEKPLQTQHVAMRDHRTKIAEAPRAS